MPKLKPEVKFERDRFRELEQGQVIVRKLEDMVKLEKARVRVLKVIRYGGIFELVHLEGARYLFKFDRVTTHSFLVQFGNLLAVSDINNKTDHFPLAMLKSIKRVGRKSLALYVGWPYVSSDLASIIKGG